MVRPANGEMVFVIELMTWEGRESKWLQQSLYPEASFDVFFSETVGSA